VSPFLNSSRCIAVIEEAQVGYARRRVVEICQRLGGDETFCGKAAIVITELARNLVLHGKGGEIVVREVPTATSATLEVLALDRGPGMRHIAECLQDGYSTRGTAGTGFGAIKRLSSRFEVFSQPGLGTVIWVRLLLRKTSSASHVFESSGVSVAVEREEVCGDAWETMERFGVLRAMVVDGLGHGPFAEQASREALAVFRSQASSGVASTLKLIDQALTTTRGAAGAIVEVCPAKGQVTAAGVGNISMRVMRNGESKSFGCDNGTLGTGVRKIREYTCPWVRGSVLVMHSDGIKTHWQKEEYPGLVRRHPGVFAGLLYRDFRRERDDATVIVVRQSENTPE
jgi:anti-sigma regulatory factor (Ser/Thr protein kinase)